MRNKTFFRLLIKAVGVLLFADGASAALQQIIGIAFALAEGGPWGGSWQWVAMSMPAMLAKAGAGLYLFFGGRWIVDKAIPGNRPYCQECGYDLTGAVRNRCPECDTAFNPEDVRPPREPRIVT